MLDQLATHGVRPLPTTPPELVHEFVSDLYRFELRRLRSRQVRGEIDRKDYSGHVVELRRKYILISVPLARWAAAEEGGAATAGAPSRPSRRSD